ncbi:MAG TPA: transketolase [Thermomicrobiales bacterium]|nr:transketolase [Thermomicrobiales bacterium]
MATATTDATTLQTQAINAIRTLAMDAVQAANSGHPGLPLGAAPMAYVLWQEFLKHNPRDPQWPDRDRFVLSAGHGSALLYSLLHLTGYDLSVDDLKAFRQLGSRTPGHPERGDTAGVEVTTGPLGQGMANGVGFAIAEQFLAATFNRPGHDIVDHFTYGIVSDGDIMEGVAFEAASIAANLKLGKLVYLYDQNHITLAATANVSFREDVPARFEALGWHVQTVDGMEPDAVRNALSEAMSETERPSLICARTVIGFGSPNKAGTFGVHGSPLGPDEVIATKENLGVPTEPPFFVPDDVYSHFHQALDRGSEAQAEWRVRFDAYKAAFPAEAATFESAIAGEIPAGWDSEFPSWTPGDKPVATRKASGEVMNAFYENLPTFIGGSADLNPSTNTVLKGGGDFGNPSTLADGEQGLSGGGWNYAGRNLHFGIREHAMGSIVNGLAAHGGIVPFGSTFLVFSDYMRPAIRLAALSHLKSIFVFTHDSVAVGEDGPTHEPVEHVMSLRAIPHLTVLRPADANETAEAWKVAMENPTASVLILSRQDLAILDRSGANGDVSKGGYVLAGTDGDPDVVIMATGSEVELAVLAQGQLAEFGVTARVVSIPSWELFEAQGEDWKTTVLGSSGTPRVSVEAGITLGWSRYLGDNGVAVGIDTYGASGPGKAVLKKYGMTKEHVAAETLRLLGREGEADTLDSEYLAGQTAGTQPKGSDGHS